MKRSLPVCTADHGEVRVSGRDICRVSWRQPAEPASPDAASPGSYERVRVRYRCNHPEAGGLPAEVARRYRRSQEDSSEIAPRVTFTA